MYFIRRIKLIIIGIIVFGCDYINTNIVSGEALAVTGSGTIVDQNVGTSKPVSLGTLALADNTGSASNYSLSSATFDVNQRPLNFSATKAQLLFPGRSTILVRRS